MRLLQRCQLLGLFLPLVLQAAPERALEPPAIPIADRIELAAAAESLLQEERFDEALELAQRELSLAADSQPDWLASTFARLGQAYFGLGRYTDALVAFERALLVHDYHFGSHAPGAQALHLWLGDVQLGMSRHYDAVASYQRAQAVAQRNEGVYSLSQMEALSRLKDVLIEMGQYSAAEAVMLTRRRLYEEHYGKDSVESVPALVEWAQWLEFRATQDGLNLRRARNIDAISSYSEAIDIVERELGAESPELVSLLRARAGAERRKAALGPISMAEAPVRSTHMPYRSKRAVRDLKRVVAIVEAQPDASVPDRIAAYVELADTHLARGDTEEAHELYFQAWQLAHEHDQTWLARLSQPEVIYHGPTPPFQMGFVTDNADVWFDFAFDVRQDGRPEQIRVIDGTMPSYARFDARVSTQGVRVRPPLVGGVPQRVEDFRFRRHYRTTRPEVM